MTYDQMVADKLIKMGLEAFSDAEIVAFTGQVLRGTADSTEVMLYTAQRLEKVAQRLEELDAPANKGPANKGER